MAASYISTYRAPVSTHLIGPMCALSDEALNSSAYWQANQRGRQTRLRALLLRKSPSKCTTVSQISSAPNTNALATNVATERVYCFVPLTSPTLGTPSCVRLCAIHLPLLAFTISPLLLTK